MRESDKRLRIMLSVNACGNAAGREKVVRDFDEAIVIERYMDAIAAATSPAADDSSAAAGTIVAPLT